jgi:hypothetical protein
LPQRCESLAELPVNHNTHLDSAVSSFGEDPIDERLRARPAKDGEPGQMGQPKCAKATWPGAGCAATRAAPDFVHFCERSLMSARKVVDCRNMPSEINCTLTISGSQDEVLKAAVEHAISTHGEKDSPELRKAILDGMEDEDTVLSRVRPDAVQPSAPH